MIVYPSMCRQRYGSDESGNTPHEQNGRDPASASVCLFSLLIFFVSSLEISRKIYYPPISYKNDNVNETPYVLYVMLVLSLSVKYVSDIFISRFNLSFRFLSLSFLFHSLSTLISLHFLILCPCTTLLCASCAS